MGLGEGFIHQGAMSVKTKDYEGVFMKNWQGVCKGMVVGMVLGGFIALPAQAQAEDAGIRVIQGGPAYFNMGLGAFNAAGVSPGVGKNNATLPEVDLEYQSGAKLFGIGSVYVLNSVQKLPELGGKQRLN